MAEQRYYEAKEAQKILGMTYSALRHQVNIGTLQSVAPPGRKQAVYLKEEVDALKREMEAWLASRHQLSTPPAKFVKATVEDVPAAVELAASVFGGLNTISVEKRVEWLKKNPDIDYLLKQDDQIVGYLTFVPLRPETIEDLMTLRRYAKDLTAEDILPYTPNEPVDVYGMAIGVRPGFSNNQKRAFGVRLILGAMDALLDLGRRGIIIRNIIAHSFTPDGIRLMRHLGFTETPPKAPGLHDFLIDVEHSGIPFVLAYKQALIEWQAASRLIAQSHADIKTDSVAERKPAKTRDIVRKNGTGTKSPSRSMSHTTKTKQ